MEQQTFGEQFEIRDMRHKEKFQIDDFYLNGYAKECGIYATGVYVSLCRHADKQQMCFPSLKRIAEELGISRSQVIRAVKKLKKHNIIKVKRMGKKLNNRYILIDKSEWSGGNFTGVRQELHLVSDRNFHSKDTQLRYTHIKDKINDDSENRPVKRKEFKVSVATYKQLTDAYQNYRGIELKGAEFGQVKQAIKTMLYSGRTSQNILDFMEFCSEQCELMEQDEKLEKKLGWLKNWTMLTIKRKMPEFLAGQLGGAEEAYIPDYAKNYINK